jgi:hypothetical protein
VVFASLRLRPADQVDDTFRRAITRCATLAGRGADGSVWTFMLAETLVLVLVILIPGLSSWIPTYFLR